MSEGNKYGSGLYADPRDDYAFSTYEEYRIWEKMISLLAYFLSTL